MVADLRGWKCRIVRQCSGYSPGTNRMGTSASLGRADWREKIASGLGRDTAMKKGKLVEILISCWHWWFNGAFSSFHLIIICPCNDHSLNLSPSNDCFIQVKPLRVLKLLRILKNMHVMGYVASSYGPYTLGRFLKIILQFFELRY